MKGNVLDDEDEIDKNSIAGKFALASMKKTHPKNGSSATIKYFNFSQLVEVSFRQARDFLRIAETLTRVGLQSESSADTIIQVCYILSKKEGTKYYVVHENELRKMDGEAVEITETNLAHRNLIIKLLVQWNLLEVVNPSQIESPVASFKGIRVISHRDKDKWNLVQPYPIGKKFLE